MDTAYLAEWANLLLRWLHLITGMAWIGASFYFMGLDQSLKPAKDGNPLIRGGAWWWLLSQAEIHRRPREAA